MNSNPDIPNLAAFDELTSQNQENLLQAVTTSRSSRFNFEPLASNQDIVNGSFLGNSFNLSASEHESENSDLISLSFFEDRCEDSQVTDLPKLSDYLPTLFYTDTSSEDQIRAESVLTKSSTCLENNTLGSFAGKKKNCKTITPHRLIEKRRRDKINQSLQELKSLVLPPAKAKEKFDKADILRLAIDHIKMLQENPKENLKRKAEDERVQEKPHTDSDRSQVYTGQHIMLGYMDCHQEAIDFLIKQANIPEDHPLISQLSAHLLKQQQNLDLKAMEKNLELVKELGQVTESNTSNHFTNLVKQESSSSENSTQNMCRTFLESTPKRAKIERESSPVVGSYSLHGVPIAETYLAPSYLTSGVSSPRVQTSSASKGLEPATPEAQTSHPLPSFPVFALPYFSPTSLSNCATSSVYSS